MSRDAAAASAAAEVDRWEAAITDELLRLFDRQEAATLARLQGVKAKKHTRHWDPPGERKIDPRYVLDPARWVKDSAASLAPVLGRLFSRVHARVAKQLDGPTLADDDQRVSDAIDVRLARVAQGVETAVEEVQTYIDAEDDAGSPLAQIADGVRDLYASRKPVWAGRIATMSAVGSINQAGLFAAADSGSSAKQWVSTRDDKVRDTHVKADRQVRLLDERFRLGGIPTHPARSLLLFPGDPSPSVPLDEVINCRCTLVFSPAKLRPTAPARVPVAAKGLELESKGRSSADFEPCARCGSSKVSHLEGPDQPRCAACGFHVALRPGVKALPKTQKCEYCKAKATKRIIHSEGMAYIPVCGEHLAKGRADAASCTPDGTADPSNIDAVRDIKDGDSHTPPAAVRSAARRGLELRREHNVGGTEVGVARARDLSGDGGVSTDTVRRMASYFARHDVDRSADGWGSTSDPSAGYVAWLLWGGDAGRSWARGVLRTVDGESKAVTVGELAPCVACGEPLRFDGESWPEASDHSTVGCPQGGSHQPLEAKDARRVRTAAGAAAYGQPIGTVIVADPLTKARTLTKASNGGRIVDASDDPATRASIAKHSTPGAVPDPAKTSVAALIDNRGRVGAYVVWQDVDGDQPAGTILSVSVHPSLRGKKLGDELVAAAAADDPRVKITTRPQTSPRSQGGGSPTGGKAPRGPKPIRSHALPDDTPGTSGDFDADAARIDRLQKAYLRDRADTKSLHATGGRWSAARTREHEAVIDHFLSAPGVKRDNQLLLIGGLPGAGKTTTINSPAGQAAAGVDLSSYVVVNADEVKEQMVARGMVPDYPGLSPDEAATLYHAESFDIAHAIMRRAGARGLNFAYDTSLKTPGQASFVTAAAASSKRPYTSTFVFVDVPVSVAKQRARDRYLAGGRYMPLALIDGMRGPTSAQSVPSVNFAGVKRLADRWVTFDNAGGAPVATGQGGGGRRARRP